MRNPRSTVAPPRDGATGAKVLELLRGLARPPPALEDEGPLGQGGMGVVRLATQVPLGRKVAVKKLAPGNTRTDDVEALLSEAWLAGALEHPNIVPVHDLGLDAEGLPVLVMKRIEGLSWSVLLRDADALATHAPGRAPLEAHLRILIQVCNALHFAHARGVVHRDVKPDNVMVGAFGEVYLVDWGIAVAPGPALQLAGTPVYMAPEMLGGEQAVISPATDVYLLGAVLFELLTGRAPHDASTPERLTASVLASAPALPQDAPMELAALVRLCMSPDPAQRPESALAVRLALEDFLAHLGSLELTTQAEQRLTELRALLTQPSPDARRVFDLFSECRFGFQQALRGWKDNVRARHGLDASVRAMVGWELEAGSPRTAQALLSELQTPDAALSEQVTAAVAKELARKAELEALERHHDPRAGSRTRFAVLFGAGLCWIVAPLLGRRLIASFPDHEMLFSAGVSGLSTLGLLVAARLGREASSKLNAQLLHMLLFAMSAQTVVLIAVYLEYGDIGQKVAPILTGSWALLAGLIAAALLREGWLTMFGYLVATLLAIHYPEHRYEAVALGNGVLCLNAWWLLRKVRSAGAVDDAVSGAT